MLTQIAYCRFALTRNDNFFVCLFVSDFLTASSFTYFSMLNFKQTENDYIFDSYTQTKHIYHNISTLLICTAIAGSTLAS